MATEQVGTVEIGEDGHRHEWRLIERVWVPVYGWQVSWYCVHCRLVRNEAEK